MFERIGEITPPCGEPSVAWRSSPSSRTPAFSQLSIVLRITPSVTRLSRKARRCECDRVEIFDDVDVQHPAQSVAHEARAKILQGLMRRPSRPKAVGAGKKVLLIDGLQHHDDRPLGHLVLEGWKTERSRRSIRLRNICP